MKLLVLMAEADHFGNWDAANGDEREAVFDRFRAETVEQTVEVRPVIDVSFE